MQCTTIHYQLVDIVFSLFKIIGDLIEALQPMFTAPLYGHVLRSQKTDENIRRLSNSEALFLTHKCNLLIWMKICNGKSAKIVNNDTCKSCIAPKNIIPYNMNNDLQLLQIVYCT